MSNAPIFKALKIENLILFSFEVQVDTFFHPLLYLPYLNFHKSMAQETKDNRALLGEHWRNFFCSKTHKFGNNTKKIQISNPLYILDVSFSIHIQAQYFPTWQFLLVFWHEHQKLNHFWYQKTQNQHSQTCKSGTKLSTILRGIFRPIFPGHTPDFLHGKVDGIYIRLESTFL